MSTVEVKWLGQMCGADDICADDNAGCFRGICSCMPGYENTENICREFCVSVQKYEQKHCERERESMLKRRGRGLGGVRNGRE